MKKNELVRFSDASYLYFRAWQTVQSLDMP